jgi:hypothetical protein
MKNTRQQLRSASDRISRNAKVIVGQQDVL